MRSLFLALVAALVLPSRAPAQSDAAWIAQVSDHFVLYTDSDAEQGTRLLADLEARHAAFTRAFRPIEPRAFRIAVVMLDDRELFESFVPDFARKIYNPQAAAVEDRPVVGKGAYVINGPAGAFILARDDDPEDIAADAAHSLGHLLLSRTVVWQPFWLQEAAGEYVRHLGGEGGDDAVSRQDGYPVADLFEIVPSRDFNDLEDGGNFRAQSYQLLRILLEDYPEEFRAYLSALAERAGQEARPDVDPAVLEEKLFAYTDSRLPLSPVTVDPETVDLVSAQVDVVLGELAISAGLPTRASGLLRSNSDRARVGLALVRRLEQGASPELRQELEAIIADFPDSGLAHYHFGTLPPETAEQRKQQIQALERAVELMPRMGRAYAELGWLHTLDGRPEAALELLARAMELEPEFADRFFEIRAHAQLRMGEYEAAEQSIQIAAALPHSDRDPRSVEHYDRLVYAFYEEMEDHRRRIEAARVEDLRREIEALREEVDPRPEPVVEEPAPIGRITYSVSSGAERGVAEPTLVRGGMPEYSADLRRERVEGRVVVEIDLDRRGEVTVDIVNADHALLGAATVEALEQWVFQPARRNNESTPFSFRMTFRFYLE